MIFHPKYFIKLTMLHNVTMTVEVPSWLIFRFLLFRKSMRIQTLIDFYGELIDCLILSQNIIAMFFWGAAEGSSLASCGTFVVPFCPLQVSSYLYSASVLKTCPPIVALPLAKSSGPFGTFCQWSSIQNTLSNQPFCHQGSLGCLSPPEAANMIFPSKNMPSALKAATTDIPD